MSLPRSIQWHHSRADLRIGDLIWLDGLKKKNPKMLIFFIVFTDQKKMVAKDTVLKDE